MVCKYWIKMGIRMITFTSGNYMYIDSQNLKNVDYKQYLGPDWVASYDSRKAPTIVGNHISWIDIMI